MINAIIVEDQPQVAEHLLFLLKKNHPEVIVLETAANITEAQNTISKYNPDLIFLDVELGQESSFTLLEKMPQISSEIIFTTAYDRYALQAIKYSCLEYLLKPIGPEELQEAISKFSARQKINVGQKRIELLLENLQQPKEKLPNIAIPTTTGFEFVKIDDIIYCKADSDYTWIYTRNAKLLASRTLKDFEKILPEDIFFRSHKSFLVNMRFVKKYTKKEGDRLEMDNGEIVELSIRKKEEFLTRINRV